MTSINILKIVGLCHEIQDAAKRKETRSGGTIMCGEIASKILRELAIVQQAADRQFIEQTTNTEIIK